MSFRNAIGIIFISNYAQKTVSNIMDLSQVKQKVINHGVSNSFQFAPRVIKNDNSKTFKFLYISSIWPYKHHLNVVRTIDKLHKIGYNIELDIVGAPDHYITSKRLKNELNEDNKRDFIFWHQNVGLDDVANFYKNADAFIFASTCENMPNILIEAMASGLPICCSNFKPMPEFIEDAAIYFDPTKPLSIESAILILLQDCILRNEISRKSFNLSKRYTWEKCARETFNFINKTITNNE
jgi:glycosyltransferase involved in cell wall biosynthesis